MFGIAPPPPEKKAVGRPKGKGKAKDDKDDESGEPKSGPTGANEDESQDEMGRVTTIAATLLEDSQTQSLEETQLDERAGAAAGEDQSDAWAETQMEEDEPQPEDAPAVCSHRFVKLSLDVPPDSIRCQDSVRIRESTRELSPDWKVPSDDEEEGQIQPVAAAAA